MRKRNNDLLDKSHAHRIHMRRYVTHLRLPLKYQCAQAKLPFVSDGIPKRASGATRHRVLLCLHNHVGEKVVCRRLHRMTQERQASGLRPKCPHGDRAACRRPSLARDSQASRRRSSALCRSASTHTCATKHPKHTQRLAHMRSSAHQTESGMRLCAVADVQNAARAVATFLRISPGGP